MLHCKFDLPQAYTMLSRRFAADRLILMFSSYALSIAYPAAEKQNETGSRPLTGAASQLLVPRSTDRLPLSDQRRAIAFH